METEKRRFPRVVTTIPAELRIVPQSAVGLPSEPIRAIIRDLSLGGAAVDGIRKTSDALSLGIEATSANPTRIYINWIFPPDQAVRAFGQIVWASRAFLREETYSAGLRFRGVSHRDMQVIASFLETCRRRQTEAQRPAGFISVCAWICGRSYGNPGPAGIGVVISSETGEVLTQVSQYVGKLTNPAAEYQALIAALTEAKKLGARRIAVFTDSVLIRLSMGRSGVKSPASNLEPLAIMARSLMASFKRVEMISVASEKNKNAQGLAELAVRGMMQKADI